MKVTIKNNSKRSFVIKGASIKPKETLEIVSQEAERLIKLYPGEIVVEESPKEEKTKEDPKAPVKPLKEENKDSVDTLNEQNKDETPKEEEKTVKRRGRKPKAKE